MGKTFHGLGVCVGLAPGHLGALMTGLGPRRDELMWMLLLTGGGIFVRGLLPSAAASIGRRV